VAPKSTTARARPRTSAREAAPAMPPITWIGASRHADADRHRRARAVAHGGGETGRELQGLLAARHGHDGGELVAADAGHGVGAAQRRGEDRPAPG